MIMSNSLICIPIARNVATSYKGDSVKLLKAFETFVFKKIYIQNFR